jgi:hypothetical protein
MNELRKNISCVRTLTVIERSLKIGIVFKGIHIKSRVGIPQGSILSPLLANIVLHKLDVFIEDEVKTRFEKGYKRRNNPVYIHYANLRRIARIGSVKEEVRKNALIKMRQIPSKDPQDPGFRRLLYIRYADDFVVLTASPKSEAIKIRESIQDFLTTHCDLTLNLEKTTVNAISEGFNFLGASCHKRTNISIYNKSKNNLSRTISRRSTLRLGVDAPIKTLINKLVTYGFARRNHLGKVLAKGLTHLIHLDHSDIIKYYNAKMLGIMNYYSFAGNRSSLHSIMWIFRQSCALTLARKLKLRTMRKAFGRFGYDLKDPKSDRLLNAPHSIKRLSEFRTGKVITPDQMEQILNKK